MATRRALKSSSLSTGHVHVLRILTPSLIPSPRPRFVLRLPVHLLGSLLQQAILHGLPGVPHLCTTGRSFLPVKPSRLLPERSGLSSSCVLYFLILD